MPTYIPKSIKHSLHPAPKNPFNAPQKWIVPAYVQSTQHEKVPDNIPPLDVKVTKYIQSKISLLLYYSQAVDPDMLPSLNEISSSQFKPTLHTKLATSVLLNYAHT